ncbi:hypothetical protein B1987_21670 [Mycobacterium kansasii]|nr:hypothetical protein B1987_21670 [Mycobacterium kansasii]
MATDPDDFGPWPFDKSGALRSTYVGLRSTDASVAAVTRCLAAAAGAAAWPAPAFGAWIATRKPHAFMFSIVATLLSCRSIGSRQHQQQMRFEGNRSQRSITTDF